MIYKSIGQRITARCIALDLSLPNLHERLSHMGWHTKDLEYLRRIVKDEISPRSSDVPDLAQALETTVAWLKHEHSDPAPTPTNDPVNHPAHYTQGGIECIDAIKAATTGLNGYEGYIVGNVLKYIWRYSSKNGLQDLEKAAWYLQKLISTVEDRKTC